MSRKFGDAPALAPGEAEHNAWAQRRRRRFMFNPKLARDDAAAAYRRFWDKRGRFAPSVSSCSVGAW
jgi:hypothetical protein